MIHGRCNIHLRVINPSHYLRQVAINNKFYLLFALLMNERGMKEDSRMRDDTFQWISKHNKSSHLSTQSGRIRMDLQDYILPILLIFFIVNVY